MDDYTFEKPDEKAYIDTLITFLRRTGHNDIGKLLENAECEIRDSGDYGNRINASATGIYFSVPVENLALITEEMEELLVGCCDKIMPAQIGFDVTYVEFSPLLERYNSSKNLSDDLEEISASLSKKISIELLPEDLKQKGKDMAEVYLYLYCVENSLRLFIEKVALKEFGENYFNELEINGNIKNHIKGRKEKEEKNKWLNLRGDSDLFYLDFEDLEKIIMNNWGIFESYFPNQNWITTKINEIADCRHLVAHNSFISEHGKNVLKIYYESILKQISAAFEN